MITGKIKIRHWLLFILITVGLILALIGLAVSRGEQHQVAAENFRVVFYLSMFGTIVFSVLLIVGALYLRRWIR